MTDIIEKYFPEITTLQREQFKSLPNLYKEWNSKINVISRRDIENVMIHHVLHSLSIAKVIAFSPNTHILDVGTGGGFPGIPLAIMFPQTNFSLIDSIGKKILVASEISKAIGLNNVDFAHRNAIDEKGMYDYVITRAVMPAADLVKMTYKNISSESRNSLTNGIITLKGGNLKEELENCKINCLDRKANITIGKIEKWEIQDFFSEDYFEEKYVIHIPLIKNKTTC